MSTVDDDLDALPNLEIEQATPRTLLVRVRGDLDAEAAAHLHAALHRSTFPPHPSTLRCP